MNPLKVIVTTCDSYIKALQPFAYLYNKYWPNPPDVIVVGFQPPPFELPSNFTFHSVGAQKDFPFKKWSNMLLHFLNDHPELTRFILMLEDYWITGPVRTKRIDRLHLYSYEQSNVLKIDLCNDRRYAQDALAYGFVDGIELVKSHYKSPYHMSLMTGLWNRHLMMRILIPDESPHDIEIVGTNRLAKYKDEILVIGTASDPVIVPHTLGVRYNNPKKILYSGLKSDDDLHVVRKMME